MQFNIALQHKFKVPIPCKSWRLDLISMGCLRSWVGMPRGVGHRCVVYGVCFFRCARSDSQIQNFEIFLCSDVFDIARCILLRTQKGTLVIDAHGLSLESPGLKYP